MQIWTADRETGSLIDRFDSIEEAKAAIMEYEEEDKKEGIFVEDFYDVVDENHRSYNK